MNSWRNFHKKHCAGRNLFAWLSSYSAESSTANRRRRRGALSTPLVTRQDVKNATMKNMSSFPTWMKIAFFLFRFALVSWMRMTKKAMIVVVAFECKFYFPLIATHTNSHGMLSCYKLFTEEMLLLLSCWVNMVKITCDYRRRKRQHERTDSFCKNYAWETVGRVKIQMPWRWREM